MRLTCFFLATIVTASIVPSAFAGKGHYEQPKGHVKCAHEHKSHFDWLCGPPPPDGPILESVAIERVPINRETSFRLRQEAGELAPEREQTCGSEKALDDLVSSLSANRMDGFDSRLTAVEARLENILNLLENQQRLIENQQRLIKDIHSQDQ